MPIRKRGLSIESMSYNRDGVYGNCQLQFEVDEDDATRIYKNMIRITDILDVEKDEL